MGNTQYVREDENNLNLKWEKQKKSIPISSLKSIDMKTCWNGQTKFVFDKNFGSETISYDINPCECIGRSVKNHEDFFREIENFCRKHNIPLIEYFTDWNGRTGKTKHV